MKVHFGDVNVSHLMEQQNERITYYEFHPVNSLLFGEVLKTRIVLEGSCSLLEPGLKGWRENRLCQSHPRTKQ